MLVLMSLLFIFFLLHDRNRFYGGRGAWAIHHSNHDTKDSHKNRKKDATKRHHSRIRLGNSPEIICVYAKENTEHSEEHGNDRKPEVHLRQELFCHIAKPAGGRGMREGEETKKRS